MTSICYLTEEWENDRIGAQEGREERRCRDERRYCHGMMQDEGRHIIASDKPARHGWVTLELGVTAEQIEAWNAMGEGDEH